jgi:NADPH:quinone reductase-like Zn-dependent oxidoreductase
MFTQGELALGERVVVHAAGSGVGLAAVQLARAAGAQTLGTARTADKLERARAYGLDEACVVSDDPQAFAAAARAWTNGAGVALILDLVGASYLAANLDALAPRGRLLLVGTLAGASAPLDFRQVMGKRLRLTGTVLRARSTEEKARATRLFAAHVAPLLARGTVRPVIDSVYDLADIRAAHLRLESNETFGKVVLRVTSDK